MGGESYELGDSLHITAKSERNAKGRIESVDILLSPDGGQTWGAISDRPHSMDTDSSLDFSWEIPVAFTANGKIYSLVENGNCMIRIAHRSAGDSLVTSTSERFKVEDTVLIRLTYPLGGESFQPGDTVPITWTTKFDPNIAVDAVDVKVSPDSGKTWSYVRPISISQDSPLWGRVPWVVTDSITIRGQKANIVGNPGVCIQVEQYSTSDPKARFRSGMISILPP